MFRVEQRRAALLIAATVLASGCAFGTRRVNLTYGPAVDNPGAGRTASGRVAVARLRDARSADEGTGTLLGKIRNAYGMPTASVHANQDPVIWVNEAIARALAGYGFKVEKVETPASAGGLPTVTGSLRRASGGMYWNMDAFIATDLAVEQGGQTFLSQQCEATASQVAVTISAESYEELFQKALDEYVKKCVPPLIPTLQEHAER